MEHAGDNAVHLSVGSEMEASGDQGAAHAVILGPIARGIRGEGLNEACVEMLSRIYPLYRGTSSHVKYMRRLCDDDQVVQRLFVLVQGLRMSNTP